MHSAHTRRSASVFPGCRHERDGGPADAKTPPFRGTEQRRLPIAWDNTVLACCSARHRHMGSILTCVPGAHLRPCVCIRPSHGSPHNDGLSPRTACAAADADFIAHSTGRARRIASPRGTRRGALSSSAPRSGLLACAIRGCHVTLFGCDYALCSSSQRSQRPRVPCSNTGGCSENSRRVSSADDFGSTGI